MATLNVVEFESLAEDAKGNLIPVGKGPFLASSNVTFTTSTASSAFNARTKFVRLIADADAYVVFGSSPTATATSMRIEANVAEYFGVIAGQAVAAYDGTS